MKHTYTYSAVVESGSHSHDYQRFEEIEHCGHKHRTIEAAKKCLDKKQRWFCQHGTVSGRLCRLCGGYATRDSTSAAWFNGTIHNQNGERV